MAEYIERAEAIKAVCDSIPHSCSLDDCQKECQEVSAIVSIPAADVRPVVRGKWIETKTGFHCSACKTKAKGTKDGALLSNFCPNCGADMRPTSMSGANVEGKHENRTD